MTTIQPRNPVIGFIRLLALGWTCTERRGGYRPWSSWSFVRPARIEET